MLGKRSFKPDHLATTLSTGAALLPRITLQPLIATAVAAAVDATAVFATSLHINRSAV